MNCLKKWKEICYTYRFMIKCRGKRLYHKLERGAEVNMKEKVYIVDMRSDTLTKPTAGMKEAMMSAVVGDDVLEEDPTVKVLENKMAEITGKEAGLFVVSGTMGNLLSVLTHCNRRGAEAVLGSQSHMYQYEQANMAQFGGIQAYTLPTKPDGTFEISQVKLRSTEKDFHSPNTELICIENTHCQRGGKVLPPQWVDEISKLCQKNLLPLHVDGARIFNASIASGLPASDLLRHADSASICLSKGLGCPIGSVIVGRKSFIIRANRLRKALGGAWRQAGIIAACGIYALENNINRLAEDHANAKLLANGINEAASSNVFVSLDDVHTNMVLMQVNPEVISPAKLCERMISVTPEEEKQLGQKVVVKAFPFSATDVRLVSHLDLSSQHIEAAVAKLKYIISELDNVV